MQALLLRFLETGEIQRVGSDQAKTTVDVRVISATNRNLLERTKRGSFREDLYSASTSCTSCSAAARAARGPPAALRALPAPQCAINGSMLSTHAPDARMSARLGWPGNVRELKNAAERMIVRARSARADVGDLPPEILDSRGKAKSNAVRVVESHASALYDSLITRGENFWSAIYEPFVSRDLTRDDVRTIVRMGLEETRGSYKQLVGLFNMAPNEYKRFLNCLGTHRVPRGVPAVPRGAGPRAALDDDRRQWRDRTDMSLEQRLRPEADGTTPCSAQVRQSTKETRKMSKGMSMKKEQKKPKKKRNTCSRPSRTGLQARPHAAGWSLTHSRHACSIPATEFLAGPCPASFAARVCVSSPAVACFLPCLSCHPCLPCLLLSGHYDS